MTHEEFYEDQFTPAKPNTFYVFEYNSEIDLSEYEGVEGVESLDQARQITAIVDSYIANIGVAQ